MPPSLDPPLPPPPAASFPTPLPELPPVPPELPPVPLPELPPAPPPDPGEFEELPQAEASAAPSETTSRFLASFIR
jgi:hypothetical protein